MDEHISPRYVTLYTPLFTALLLLYDVTNKSSFDNIRVSDIIMHCLGQKL